MKTKLLKKVRRRYKISKLTVQPWMSKSTDFFEKDCWNHRNEKSECYVTVDMYEKEYDRMRVSPTYEMALEWLVFYIRKDYPSKRKFNQKEKIIWGEHQERNSVSPLLAFLDYAYTT